MTFPAVSAETVSAGTGSAQDCTPAQRITKSLLGYGVVAGAVFGASILIQGATRHGFRIAEARAEFTRAAALTSNERERELFAGRAAGLTSPGERPGDDQAGAVGGQMEQHGRGQAARPGP